MIYAVIFSIETQEIPAFCPVQQATRKVWTDLEAAKRYAAGMNPNWKPQVVQLYDPAEWRKQEEV